MINPFKKKPRAFINIDIENGRMETRFNINTPLADAEDVGLCLGAATSQDHPAARAFLRGLVDGWGQRYGEPSYTDAFVPFM
jgi:hypothetical protein